MLRQIEATALPPSRPRCGSQTSCFPGAVLSALHFICDTEESGARVQLSTQSRSSNGPTTLHRPDGACAGAIVASYRGSAFLHAHPLLSDRARRVDNHLVIRVVAIFDAEVAV
jgi:hypothetical protein